MGNELNPHIGVVVIGRNEGDRLRACLESVAGNVSYVVYVDSGSTDGSVEMARMVNVHVVQLDMNLPFTAARARNEGWRTLLNVAPQVEFVQFVDGDCVVAEHWLETAHAFLSSHSDYAVVCGRRRERYPERSIYNYLCDLEWDTPIGNTRACGGDALMRVTALKQVEGYRDDLIAGEEPELCVRMRQLGWLIRREDAEMTMHDANITRFGQWWKRNKRAGHAYAEGAWLHGSPPERHKVRERKRALFWGLLFPASVFLLVIVHHSVWLLFFCAYPLQIWRLRNSPGGWLQAFFLVLGKFPEAAGVLQFLLGRLRQTRATLIEYK